MSRSNETQKIHFFGANWCEEYDITLFATLKNQCSLDYKCVPLNNSRYLHMIVNNAAEFVNYHHDTTFTSDEILVRFENLAAQHQCFRMILGHKEVSWDVEKNVVTTTEAIWENFVLKNLLALAYRENGEYAWFDLEKLFGVVEARAKVIKLRPPRTSREMIEFSRRMRGKKCNPRNGTTAVCDRMSDMNGVRLEVEDDSLSDADMRKYLANNAAASSQASCSAVSREI